jgi:signal transduction histidine kinase
LSGGAVRLAAAVWAILALAGVSVVSAATSHHVEHPTATAFYHGYVVAASLLVGLYWYLRRPGSAFGALLALFGISFWVVSWQSLDWPLAFDVGVLAEAVAFVLTFYLFLAFPSGRLQTLGNRLLVAGAAAPVLFFVPWALLSPAIAGGGALSGCRPACPANLLQVASNPGAVEFLGRWEGFAMLALVLAVLGVYWRRVATASRPQRRALLAVAASSLLFLPMFFVYHFSRLVLHADPTTLEWMSWPLVGARVIVPLGFLAALFHAERFAGTVRGRLLDELLLHPTPQQWRDAVAVALDDPALRIGYWDPTADRYREAAGTELASPAPDSERSRVEAHRDGQPVAAMVIDDALAEDPELVRAATSATVLAVENGHLEGELRASQGRIREVGAAERKRIQDNLHDSAQQRLAALRIRLALTSERLRGPEQLELQRFGAELDQVIEEVRMAAGGAAPPELARHGVAAALRSLTRSTVMRVAVEDRGFGRRSEVTETTVFYCCAEALQNVTKHAGPSASANVLLTDGDGCVQFRVEDNGPGFDPNGIALGQGLGNMHDRLAAARGSLTIDTALGHGTRISGRLPADA